MRWSRKPWIVTLVIGIALLSIVFGRKVKQPATFSSSIVPLPAPLSSPLSVGKPLPRIAVAEELQPTFSPRAWVNARVLSEESEPQPNGTALRVQVLADPASHYPVRVEELIERTADGREMAVGRLAMAAGHVLARVRPGLKHEMLLPAVKLVGVSAVSPVNTNGLVRLQLAESTPRALPRALAALEAAQHLFVYAEPDYIVRTTADPNDPAYLSGELWGLRNTGQAGGLNDADIDADEAWNTRTEASGIIVAVVDTGIRYTHQDLAANMWTNPGEVPGDGIDNDGNGVVDDLHGFNAIGGTGNPMDDHFHGTHVAGTIGARGNDGIGVSGVAWGVRLMAVKFIGSEGSGFESDAIEGIDYARQMGAQIMNNSWGGPGYSQSLADAIERARQAGILFVAAAGNNGVSSDGAPLYPAAYAHDNIISVAASTRTDTLASFSNHGLRTVDIAAPGAAIYSADNSSDSAYQMLSGTSMATPHVSGALALLKAQFPDLTYLELIDRLLATADHPSGFARRVRSQGRLNLERALTATTFIRLPTIAQQPQSTSVEVGGSVTLMVTAEGGMPLGYQWRRSGLELPGANASSLTLSNVQASDAGNYSVLVSNVSGLTLSEEARLRVVHPATILAGPEGATLPVDGTFVAHVLAIGDQPLRYQWRKDNGDIPGATNETLAIYGVRLVDAGVYSVRVTNPVNGVDSAPAVLAVLAPPVIITQPEDQIGFIDGSVTFSVSASGALLDYQWFKDGVPLAGGTSATLTLNNLQAASVGSYSVQVMNGAGQMWSASAGLTVKDSPGPGGFPRFTEHPTDQTVNAGATVTFSAAAMPGNVTYQWRKNGADIAGADAATLTLPDVSSQDDGVYTLTAVNVSGSAASRGARLTIGELPVITQQPASVTARPETAVVFEVSATSTTPLNYQWDKDGQPISGATGRRLLIAGASAIDTGTYRVSVSNLAGTVVSSPATLSFATATETTWRQVDPGQDMMHQYCAAGTPNGIYVGSEDGVFSLSRDSGRTWSRLRPGVGLGPFRGGIRGVAYGNGRYVAVGWDNAFNSFSLTSLDGVTWTRHAQPVVPQMLRHNGSAFYGVIQSTFFSSVDGITWTQVYAGSDYLQSVCLGAGRYVAVGSGGEITTSTNGTDWEAVPSGTGGTFFDVCHGAAGFVAVGDNGAMASSLDGLSWIEQPKTTTHRLWGVDFGNDRYVVAGGSPFVGAYQPAVTLVSTNGVTWKRTSNHANGNLLGVAFANGQFVAFGDYGHLLTSEDGEDWTLRRPPDAQVLNSVAQGNGMFVTVGWNGIVRKSKDGLNWVTTQPGPSENFGSVSFGAGRFIVGVDDGALYTSVDAVNWQRQVTGAGVIGCVRQVNGLLFTLTDSGEILSSPDALSWTRSPVVTGAPLKHIAWGGSLYAACGFDGTIVTSPDGHTWTRQDTPTLTHLFGIAYGNGRFVAVGSEIMLTSTDGVSWVLTSPGTNVHPFGITYANGQFVAAGYAGLVMTSPDGLEWTQQTSGATATFTRVEFLNDQYVATGSGTSCSSTDGVSWNPVSLSAVQDVTYGNGQYVAVGPYSRLFTGTQLDSMFFQDVSSGDLPALEAVTFQGGKFLSGVYGTLFTSVDGENWARTSFAGQGFCFGRFAYGAGRYVSVGCGGVILHSPDAVNWTRVQVPDFFGLNDVVFGGGQFVAVGSSGEVATSPDGITWTKRLAAAGNLLQSVAYGNGAYVALDFPFQIVSSPDGINWAVQHAADSTLQALVFSGGHFVASAQFGKMHTSRDGLAWSVGERDTALSLFGLLDYGGATFGVGDQGVIAVSAPPPVISSQPLSQHIRVGSPVTLSVAVTNSLGLQYQWFKDGLPLVGATNFVLSWERIGPQNAGGYVVRVTSLGGEVDSIRALLTVTPQPFDTWRIGYFGESDFLDPANELTRWGPLADPDGDRLSNLAEYAYGLNPLTAELALPLEVDVSMGRLRVRFIRRKNDPALKITPAVSSDLTVWRSGAGMVDELEVTPVGPDTERVTLVDIEPTDPATQRFMRLQIHLNE